MHRPVVGMQEGTHLCARGKEEDLPPFALRQAAENFTLVHSLLEFDKIQLPKTTMHGMRTAKASVKKY